MKYFVKLTGNALLADLSSTLSPSRLVGDNRRDGDFTGGVISQMPVSGNFRIADMTGQSLPLRRRSYKVIIFRLNQTLKAWCCITALAAGGLEEDMPFEVSERLDATIKAPNAKPFETRSRDVSSKLAISGLLRAVFILLPAVPVSAQSQIPEGPPGRALQAFLIAFNSAERSPIEDYVKTYDPPQTVEALLSFRAQTGGFTLLSIERSTSDTLTFRVKGNSDNIEAYGKLLLASTAPPKVKLLSIRALPPDAVLDDRPVDAAERQRVIEGVIANLKENYVYPDTAEKMSTALQAHQQKGDYNGIIDGNILANQLVEDLRAVSHDRHLRLDYSPFKLPPERQGPDPAALARMRNEMEHMNCGFEKLEILPHNIGYVKFNMFANPEICGPTVVAAMNFLTHVDAIIFDLRDNGGGDPRMVALIATYLFDRPEHLSDIYNRKEDSTTQFWTLSYVPGARLASTPAFVLTSGRTFSGAEDFTYNLQAIKRVTVVGETTGGGAHPVAGHRIDDHFMVGVPFARSINLTTKTNWEGTGVTPDVIAKASEALTVAEKLAEDKVRANHPQPK